MGLERHRTGAQPPSLVPCRQHHFAQQRQDRSGIDIGDHVLFPRHAEIAHAEILSEAWPAVDAREGQGEFQLTGGADADTFVFTAVGDSVVGAGADRITDFARSQGDKIDLSAIDANTAIAGNQAFTFIGSGLFTHRAGELRAVNTSPGVTTIAADVNGDGASDFHITLTGNFALVASDFMF